MAFLCGLRDKKAVFLFDTLLANRFLKNFLLLGSCQFLGEREIVYSATELFKLRWCQNTFQMCPRILLYFKCWNRKQLFPTRLATRNLPEAFEMQTGKEIFFSFRVILLRFETAFGFSSNLVFLDVNKGQLHVYYYYYYYCYLFINIFLPWQLFEYLAW